MKHSKEHVKKIMDQVSAMDLPDGAYRSLVHELLKLPYGDVFDYIAADPAFFGAKVSVS